MSQVGGIYLIHFYTTFAVLGAVLTLAFPSVARICLDRYNVIFTVNETRRRKKKDEEMPEDDRKERKKKIERKNL